MKNIVQFLMVAVIILLTVRCEDTAPKVTYDPAEVTAPVASVTTTSVVLKQANKNDKAIEFDWSAADFAFESYTTYTVQIDKASGDFTTSISYPVNTLLTKSFTHGEFNDATIRLGLPSDVEATIKVRVVASAGKLVNVSSNVLSVTVTPYSSEPPYVTVYMVGPATEAGWDANVAVPMFRDPDNSLAYSYIGHFNQGQLKFLAIPGKWAPLWGTNAANAVVLRPLDSDPDPWAFWVDKDSYYKVTLNVITLEYSLTEYDPSAATQFDVIYISGSFNGWGDLPLSATTANPHIWKIEYSFDNDIELKFHTASWSVQYGPRTGRGKLYGQAPQGAGNDDKVAVKAGSYTIIFNDITGDYVFIPK